MAGHVWLFVIGVLITAIRDGLRCNESSSLPVDGEKSHWQYRPSSWACFRPSARGANFNDHAATCVLLTAPSDTLIRLNAHRGAASFPSPSVSKYGRSRFIIPPPVSSSAEMQTSRMRVKNSPSQRRESVPRRTTK